MTTSEDMFVQANKEHESGRTKKAYKLFVRAARAGHPYAQNSVGYFLDNGIGVAQNKKKAIHWYRKAARKGDICAIQNLGIVYRDLRNLRRAIFWLTRAVAAGDGDAALELAKIHLAREKTSRRKRGEAYLRTAVGSKSRHAELQGGSRFASKKKEPGHFKAATADQIKPHDRC